MLAFLSQQMDTQQFSKLANAFSDKSDGGSFKHLMNQVQSKAKTSLVYPTCELETHTTFLQSLMSRLDKNNNENKYTYVTYLPVSRSDLLQHSQAASPSTPAAQLTPADDDSQLVQRTLSALVQPTSSPMPHLFVVRFPQSSSAQENDAWMEEIVSQVDKSTNGDFIALWTTDSYVLPPRAASDESQQQQPAGPIKVPLSLMERIYPPSAAAGDILQSSNGTGDSGNTTQTATEGILYIEQYTIQGIFTMFLLLLIFLVSFCAVNAITVAPHLSDDTFTTVDVKKNQ
jgi:hypothetical protein